MHKYQPRRAFLHRLIQEKIHWSNLKRSKWNFLQEIEQKNLIFLFFSDQLLFVVKSFFFFA